MASDPAALVIGGKNQLAYSIYSYTNFSHRHEVLHSGGAFCMTIVCIIISIFIACVHADCLHVQS